MTRKKTKTTRRQARATAAAESSSRAASTPGPKPGSTLHRGPSKVGKKQLSIHVTEEERAGLRALADRNCRSTSAQLLYLLRLAIGTADEEPG